MGSAPPLFLSVPLTPSQMGFTGSSSSACLEDDEVVEIPPLPANRVSKRIVQKKQKEVQLPLPEIIDIDDSDDEDSTDNKLLFKRFDVVEQFPDHHYSKTTSSWTKQPPKQWAKKIQEEWKLLDNHLPDAIFVRVCESRMDILRAVIIGAEGTPYHDGLFFFDVSFPSNYPSVPPLVYYHSRGHRINPNLYNNGKVCLSLLNTWSGGPKEMWNPKESTIFQVLVSIQGLILNAKPYFNEPGYAGMSGTPNGEKNSQRYSEKTLILSLKTMVCSIRNPPKHLEELVNGHFFRRARDILLACKSYIDGAQVGCLVKGGVQNLEQGDTTCSESFRKQLVQYIPTLVEAFRAVNVNDCDEFLSLTPNLAPKKKRASAGGKRKAPEKKENATGKKNKV